MIDILEQETVEWGKGFTSMIDASLGSIQGLPVEERDMLIDYLKRTSADMPESARRPYYIAVSSLINKDGVKFEKLSFADALKKAEVEGKLLFMDCYTVWCGPCQVMNEQVFPLKPVGDLFNKHFINLKVDMEKGEGVELRKKFDINAFPTMLILDINGEIIHKIQGSRNAKALVEEIEKILN